MEWIKNNLGNIITISFITMKITPPTTYGAAIQNGHLDLEEGRSIGSVAKYLECVIRVIRARPLWREGGQVLGIMSKSM